ncbi:hypothetical protein L7F22_032429 [Adiantum nelumboides]|nr:hypothetical protein [Adiantum nelumboides]MCO5578585.1 hypothetical protein [Adiantum nelumboides]
MEAKKLDLPRDTACSFETVLHPEYETIKAKCDPWLLTVARPTSPTAADFWVNSLFTYLVCLSYPHGPADRVTNLAKFISWLFVCDDEDDDPALLGCDSIDSPALRGRQKLILACHTDNPLGPHQHALHDNASNHPRTVESVKVLRDVWGAMCKDMSPRLQARLYDAMRDYLNGVALQAHFRCKGIIPTVDEYTCVRRASSLIGVCFILLEYANGVELDEETLQNERIQQLFDAGIDHVALTNDIMSCHVELFKGDQSNLPAIIYWNNVKKHKANSTPTSATIESVGYTFQEAMEDAKRTLNEVDERCKRLTEELFKLELVKKKGIEAYVNGIGAWIAGNKTWSLKTARYTHSCPPEQDLVLAVEQQEPTNGI